jgi:ADP-ribose pyrophosphatase
MEWKKVDEKLIKEGWRKVITRKFILPNGKKESFEIKKEADAVCVLAITKDKVVILVKQFRPGPEKILLELPGGCIDKNEKPLAAVKRELLEETGYVGDVKFVQTIADCGYSTRWRHCFVAIDCYKLQEPKTDETEFIEVVKMPLKDFREHLRSGQLTDVDVGYIGLDFLKLL